MNGAAEKFATHFSFRDVSGAARLGKPLIAVLLTCFVASWHEALLGLSFHSAGVSEI